MTDPHLDELASAHLDGATTPAEAAQIAADPSLQARVEALRAVRAAVADVPPADPVRREAAIAAALAAADAADDPTVTPLRAPTPRRGPSPAAWRALGAAAAIALLALLVPVLGRLADSGSDDQASFDSTGAALDEADSLEAAERAEDGAEDTGTSSTTAASPGDLDLGPFDDLASLVAALSAPGGEALLQRDAPAPDVQAFDPAGCAEPSGVDAGASRVARRAQATVAGEPVVVVVRGTDDARTLVVYRASDCEVLSEGPL